MTGTFDDKGVIGTAGVVGAITVVPIVGFFVTGTSAVLPKGENVGGFIDEDVESSFANTGPRPLEVPVAAPPITVPVVPVSTIFPAAAPASSE